MTVSREIGRPLAEEEALELLAGWAESGCPCGVLYSRADGRFFLALRGPIALRGDLLSLRGEAARFHARLAGGDFRHGPVSLFEGAFAVRTTDPGLHVYSPEGDWLFISPALAPELAGWKLPA